MLNDARGFEHIYLCCGYTDLRKGIDGLISVVTGSLGLDPALPGSIFLFCGRRTDRIKALLYEGDGWLLCYKRLTEGRFSGRGAAMKPVRYQTVSTDGSWRDFLWSRKKSYQIPVRGSTDAAGDCPDCVLKYTSKSA